MKEKAEKIFYIICLILICVLMFFWIDKKQGFHEDETFSYGSSNCDDCNVYQVYGKRDENNIIFLNDNPFITIKKLVYYKLKPDEYKKVYDETYNGHTPIWRTREEATEYMTLDKDELFNYFIVYYNTGEDVHPPLFYFFVHFVSSFWLGSFSKYIIFIINLAFLILTCFMIKKILEILKKAHLTIPTTCFYALSMGAIATVMFQRMYMMLTFFCVWFLYVNLKIYFNEFEMTKKLKLELCLVIILGFLTQYYFCVYAAFVAGIMLVFLLKRKEFEKTKTYIIQFIKSAIIGIIVFIPCIYHIFFSYRGVAFQRDKQNFFEMVPIFIEEILKLQFGSVIVGIICSVAIIIISLIIFKKIKNKELILLLTVPVLLYFLIISKLAPFKSVRYIMNLLPLISIIIMLILDKIFKSKKISFIVLSIFVLVISVYTNLVNTPKYLYLNYSDYMKVAEKNKDNKLVFVSDAVYNHLRNIKEFMTYEESLILAPGNLEQLESDEKLKSEDEFILSIQKWIRK